LTVNGEVRIFSNSLQIKDEASLASAGCEVRRPDINPLRLIWPTIWLNTLA
jgi:hypothetical protein